MKKTLTPRQAFEHLQRLSSITCPAPQRRAAIDHLAEIADMLGTDRIKRELLPYLSDLIESQPEFPLFPFAAPDDAVEPQPTNPLWELLGDRRRPPLPSLSQSAEGRQILSKCGSIASDFDYILESTAKQLPQFIRPVLFDLEGLGTLVNIYTNLICCPEMSVRLEAVKGLVDIISRTEDDIGIRTGVIETVVTLATSDTPVPYVAYKKASVAYVIAPILNHFNHRADISCWPLQAELLKHYFEIVQTSSPTVLRRAYAVNFPMIVTALAARMQRLSKPDDFLFEMEGLVDRPDNVMTQALRSLGLKRWELEICWGPWSFVLDTSGAVAAGRWSELKNLSVPMSLNVLMFYFNKWVRPTLKNLDRFPTIRTVLETPEAPYYKHQHPDFYLEERTAWTCNRCWFGFTQPSMAEGVFSMGLLTSFAAMFNSYHDGSGNLTKMYPVCEDGLAKYKRFVKDWAMPIFSRIIKDDAQCRTQLMDNMPFLFELLASFLPYREALDFIEHGWLAILAEDETCEVRQAGIQRLPLTAWVYSQSCCRQLLEPDATPTNADAQTPFDMPQPTGVASLGELRRCVERMGAILQSASNDEEVRLQLAAGECAVAFMTVIHDTKVFADHLISAYVNLLVDRALPVKLHALASLSLLATVETPPKPEDLFCLKPKSTGGITNPISPLLLLEKFLPFNPRTYLNPLEESRPVFEAASNLALPVMCECLTAVATVPIQGEGPVEIPVWRIRCGMLHALPVLDKLFRLSEAIMTGKSPSQLSMEHYERYMQCFRGCLYDRGATAVQKCAAEVLVQMGKTAYPGFVDEVTRPIYTAILTGTASLTVRHVAHYVAMAFLVALQKSGGVHKTTLIQRLEKFGLSGENFKLMMDANEYLQAERVGPLKAAALGVLNGMTDLVGEKVW